MSVEQSSIDQILDFFRTGQIEIPTDFNSPLPEFEAPGVLKLTKDNQDRLLSIAAVKRRLLADRSEVMQVSFDSFNQNGNSYPWRELQVDELVGGGFTYPFSSTLSVVDNLSNFAQTYLSPHPETEPTDGPSFHEQVENWRRARSQNNI